jgi:hypothetical protein
MPSKLIILDAQQGFSCPFPNGGAVLLIPRSSFFVVHWYCATFICWVVG